MLHILSIVEISVSLSEVNIYYKDRLRHFPGLTFVLSQMKTLLGTDFYVTQSQAHRNTYLIKCRFLSSECNSRFGRRVMTNELVWLWNGSKDTQRLSALKA